MLLGHHAGLLCAVTNQSVVVPLGQWTSSSTRQDNVTTATFTRLQLRFSSVTSTLQWFMGWPRNWIGSCLHRLTVVDVVFVVVVVFPSSWFWYPCTSFMIWYSWLEHLWRAETVTSLHVRFFDSVKTYFQQQQQQNLPADRTSSHQTPSFSFSTLSHWATDPLQRQACKNVSCQFRAPMLTLTECLFHDQRTSC